MDLLLENKLFKPGPKNPMGQADVKIPITNAQNERIPIDNHKRRHAAVMLRAGNPWNEPDGARLPDPFKMIEPPAGATDPWVAVFTCHNPDQMPAEGIPVDLLVW